jgi:hypothetical protein
MNDDSTRSSSSSNSSASAASRQLVRRLNGIGRPHWSVATDIELVRHLSADHTLPDLDLLSECIVRMEEHIQGAGLRAKREFFGSYVLQPAGYTELCNAVGSALQQLAQGVQQQLQQGQLPAALTQRAVEACCALCAVLTWLCSYTVKHEAVGDDEAMVRQWLHGFNCTTGELRVSCVTEPAVIAQVLVFTADQHFAACVQIQRKQNPCNAH